MPLSRIQALPPLLFLTILSGIPLELGNATLQSWLADAAPSLSVKDIGFYSLVGLPYVLKPLWAPFLDRYAPPRPFLKLGRRRGWIAIFQVACAMALMAMALTDAERSPLLLGFWALILAFSSASQDIVVDAWRTDILPAKLRGLGASFAAWGYRIGMMLAGVSTPFLAVHFQLGWSMAYLIMAALMLMGPLVSLWAPREPPAPYQAHSLQEAIVLPFKAFFTQRRLTITFLLLLLITTYKLGDAFGSSHLSTFLQRGMGFDPYKIATIRKTYGLIASLLGMFLGGLLMLRMRVVTALLVFGVLQGVTNLLFVWLSHMGQDTFALTVTLVGENIAGGLGSIAFVAFITALCDVRFSATQYALFSALAALPSKILGPLAGAVQEQIGWSSYFVFSAYLAIPGLILVLFLWSYIQAVDLREELA